MDLDSFSGLQFAEGYFDAMVFADVLEHLKDPQRILKEMLRYLAPRGIFVVSLPNVARFEVRLRLLLGRFAYATSGIMDRTHLHFYTYSSAKSLVESTGYRIGKIEFTGIGSRIRILPRLFSYQFIIAAWPPGMNS
jgi:ubiquinone/menaquinone biosynthesis C-methylase UbiE